MEVDPTKVTTANTTWNILMIEDDEEDYLIARDMLKEARGRKCEVSWASTYEAGREALTEGGYDAVLVDYDLGRRSGIELIREAAGGGYPFPFILFTGRGSYEVDLEAMQAGATLYLTKDEANPLLLERAIRYAIEMKQKEQALSASEEQLRTVIENLPQGIIVVDPRGETLHWNRAALEMHGYQKQGDQLSFLRNLVDVYELRTLDGRVLPYEQWPVPRLLHGESFEDYELLLIYKGTDWRRVFSYSGTPVNSGGQMEMALLAIRDVTHEKELEGELRRALAGAEEGQRMLDALMENVPEGITIAAAPDVTIHLVSRYGQEMLGGAHDQKTAKQVADEWKVYDKDGVTPLPPEQLPLMRAIQKGEVVRNQDLVQVNAAGQRLYLACNAGPIRDAEGNITGGVVAWREISERRQVEEALRQSEKRLRRLMEGNIIGINIRDASGHIKDANSTFLHMTGYSAEDLRAGKLVIQDLTPPAFWKIDQAAIHEAQATGSCRPYEKEYLHKDGHTIPALVGYTQLDEGEENFIGYVVDLTELKQTQAALQEYADKLKRSNQELEQFAFVASHDLQEPLRKVKLFGQSIQMKLNGSLDEDAQDKFSRMMNAVERMQTMIQDLLELSRVNTRGQPFVEVDLAQVAAEVVSDLETRIHRTDGEVILDPLPVIEADPIQMHQVLQNLIGNALKFHKADIPPVVRVSSEMLKTGKNEKPKVLIRVEDNGIGFDPAYFEQILQPFGRLHGRAEYEGTGIGLAIVKKIIDRHQGEISASSQPGEGAAFLITLPLQQG